MESNFMTEVSEQEFESFFKGKEFDRKAGEWFHSTYFVINNEKVGYMETSSWGAPNLYKLKYTSCNSQTTFLITNILNQKSKK